MSQRKAVTKARATAYARGSRAKKTQILNELVELTGWHRDYARAALRDALKPKLVRPRKPRSPTYGPRVIAALVKCWAVLRAPAGKRLAPMLPTLVPLLRRDDEIDLSDDEAVLLMQMSAATIDRRLAGERAKLMPRGRSHTKPGSLLKSQIPVRTWAEWDEAIPGFVEIDLVGHDGGNSSGEFCFTLTVTNIATGWTVNRSVRNKPQKWVFEALEQVVAVFPFPILGIDSDNGSEFINDHLLSWCEQRNGAKITEKHDTATTPHQRAAAHEAVRKRPKITMNAQVKRLKPAALSRQILALTGELETLAQAKKAPRTKPPVNHAWNNRDQRRSSNETTS